MRLKLWQGVSLLTLSGLLLLSGGTWFWWRSASAPPSTSAIAAAAEAQPIQLQVPPGTPAEAIGEQLLQAGLIRSLTAWKLLARWRAVQDSQGGFQSGTYAFAGNESLAEVAEKIWTGDVVQTGFTIPEGWSLRQMAAYFESEGFFTAAEFMAEVQKIPYEQYPWLPENIPHLEGYLYPDTYQVPVDQLTPKAVVQIMLDRFAQTALPLYQAKQGQTNLSFKDWVTLSSIVEQEAVIPAERPLIAGVFLNRLRENIPLGADPTVEYGLNVQQTPDQPLTLAQVNTPTAYNTYLNAGLTPTPISSPGLASLEAVLSPESTDYLYFVARYDGTHVFSRTLSEHERAQAAIRDRQDAQSSTPTPDAPTSNE